MTDMRKVYICAPLGGDVLGNLERAKEYAKFALECGAAPVVPHFYSLILDDDDPEQRSLGMSAGQALLLACDEVWVFTETMSAGMQAEIALAEQLNITIRRFGRKYEISGGFQFYEKKKGY